MEISLWHLFIVFSCLVNFPCTAVKTFSLNESIAAERRGKTSEGATRRTKSEEASAERYSLSDALTSPFKQYNKLLGHQTALNKVFSPLDLRRAFEIKSPLRPKKLRHLKDPFKQVRHQTVHKNDNVVPKYIPLLKDIGMLFDDFFTDTSNTNNKKPKFNKSRNNKCNCGEHSEFVKHSEEAQETVVSTRDTAYKDATTAKSSSRVSPYHTTYSDLSAFRANKKLPVLFPRNSFGSRRNSNGLSSRSRSSFHNSFKRNITRNNRANELNTSDTRNETSSKNDEENTHSVSGEYSGSSRLNRPLFWKTGNIENRKAYNKFNKTSNNKTFFGVVGRELSDNRFDDKERKQEPIQPFGRKLRKHLPENKITNNAKFSQPAAHKEKINNYVAFNSTSNKRDLNRVSSSTKQNENIFQSDERISKDSYIHEEIKNIKGKGRKSIYDDNLTTKMSEQNTAMEFNENHENKIILSDEDKFDNVKGIFYDEENNFQVNDQSNYNHLKQNTYSIITTEDSSAYEIDSKYTSSFYKKLKPFENLKKPRKTKKYDNGDMILNNEENTNRLGNNKDFRDTFMRKKPKLMKNIAKGSEDSFGKPDIGNESVSNNKKSKYDVHRKNIDENANRININEENENFFGNYGKLKVATSTETKSKINEDNSQVDLDQDHNKKLIIKNHPNNVNSYINIDKVKDNKMIPNTIFEKYGSHQTDENTYSEEFKVKDFKSNNNIANEDDSLKNKKLSHVKSNKIFKNSKDDILSVFRDTHYMPDKSTKIHKVHTKNIDGNENVLIDLNIEEAKRQINKPSIYKKFNRKPKLMADKNTISYNRVNSYNSKEKNEIILQQNKFNFLDNKNSKNEETTSNSEETFDSNEIVNFTESTENIIPYNMGLHSNNNELHEHKEPDLILKTNKVSFDESSEKGLTSEIHTDISNRNIISKIRDQNSSIGNIRKIKKNVTYPDLKTNINNVNYTIKSSNRPIIKRVKSGKKTNFNNEGNAMVLMQNKTKFPNSRINNLLIDTPDEIEYKGGTSFGIEDMVGTFSNNYNQKRESSDKKSKKSNNIESDSPKKYTKLSIEFDDNRTEFDDIKFGTNLDNKVTESYFQPNINNNFFDKDSRSKVDSSEKTKSTNEKYDFAKLNVHNKSIRNNFRNSEIISNTDEVDDILEDIKHGFYKSLGSSTKANYKGDIVDNDTSIEEMQNPLELEKKMYTEELIVKEIKPKEHNNSNVSFEKNGSHKTDENTYSEEFKVKGFKSNNKVSFSTNGSKRIKNYLQPAHESYSEKSNPSTQLSTKINTNKKINRNETKSLNMHFVDGNTTVINDVEITDVNMTTTTETTNWKNTQHKNNEDNLIISANNPTIGEKIDHSTESNLQPQKLYKDNFEINFNKSTEVEYSNDYDKLKARKNKDRWYDELENAKVADHNDIKNKTGVVIIIDGYSVARDKNGDKNFARNAFQIRH